MEEFNNDIALKEHSKKYASILMDQKLSAALEIIAKETGHAALVLNSYGKIVWANHAFTLKVDLALDVKGLSLCELRQRQPGLVWLSMLEQQMSKELSDLPAINGSREGSHFTIEKIRDEFHGEHLYAVFERGELEKEGIRQDIQQINDRFEHVTKQAKVGIWEFDVVSKTLVWNDVLFELYGLKEKLPSDELIKLWRSTIHRDDRQRILGIIDRQSLTGMPSITRDEYRVSLPDKCLYFQSTSIVENHHGRIKVLGTTTDITNVKLHEQHILKQNAELTKTNRELDRFVYSISHDLRSPLLSIKGLSTLIKEGEMGDSEHNYIDLILQSVERLDDTIQEILDYSRNTRTETVSQEFDIKELILDVFKELSHITSDIDLKLDVQGPVKVWLDKSRVKIALKNIIANAIKYRDESKPQPQVDVGVKVTEVGCVIVVADNGEGIASEYQGEVFDMFYRASTSSPGTGLGLYISKEILSKLGGHIKLDSVESEGTTVTITIPMSL